MTVIWHIRLRQASPSLKLRRTSRRDKQEGIFVLGTDTSHFSTGGGDAGWGTRPTGTGLQSADGRLRVHLRRSAAWGHAAYRLHWHFQIVGRVPPPGVPTRAEGTTGTWVGSSRCMVPIIG